jgi:hypothetical protein
MHERSVVFYLANQTQNGTRGTDSSVLDRFFTLHVKVLCALQQLAPLLPVSGIHTISI